MKYSQNGNGNVYRFVQQNCLDVFSKVCQSPTQGTRFEFGRNDLHRPMRIEIFGGPTTDRIGITKGKRSTATATSAGSTNATTIWWIKDNNNKHINII